MEAMESELRPRRPSHQTARPQSHRFLQETLQKLGEDSMRAGSPSPPLSDADMCNSRGGSPLPSRPSSRVYAGRDELEGAACGSTTPAWSSTTPYGHRQNWMSGSPEPFELLAQKSLHGGRVRTALQEDADTVLSNRQMALFLEGWSSQFLEWRSIDEQVARQLKGQISNLEDKNENLIQFLNDYITTAEFSKFKDAMNNYSRLVDELANSTSAQNSFLGDTIDKAVHKAVVSSMHRLDQELELKEEKRHSIHISRQEGVAAEIRSHLDDQQKHIAELARSVASQEAYLRGHVEKAMQEVGNRVENQLHFAEDLISKSAQRAFQDASASMVQAMDAEHDKFRAELSRLVTGQDEKEDGPQVSLRALMNNVDECLQQGVSTSQQAEHWREALERERTAFEESEQALASSKVRTEEITLQLRELEATVQSRTAEMKKAQLAASTPTSWPKYLENTDQIISRGRIRLSLQEEWMEMLHGMEFQNCKPTESPTAQWKDEAAADATLSDLAELMLGALHGVPAVVEAHMNAQKGNLPFWQALTASRAQLVVNALKRKGVQARFLSAAGCYGKDGLERPAIRLRIGLFPQKKAAEEQTARSPRGKKR